MKNEPVMTDKQRREAAKLIRKICANYDRETKSCLLLELDYEPVACPQIYSYSLLCRYFRNAVLPSDQELMAEIIPEPRKKTCINCGLEYIPTGRNSKYCHVCSKQIRAQKTAARVHRFRGDM